MLERFTWIILLVVLAGLMAVRSLYLDVPLERDEGEYAYAGQLILQGVPPYEGAYNMKMPGIYAAYAILLSLFGQSHSGIHLGLLLINASTALMVFFLVKRFHGPVSGVAAAAAFGMLSMLPSVQGFHANAEHFVILAALAGLLLLLKASRSEGWYALLGAGALLGLAFTMKQHGLLFILFGGLYFFYCELWRRPLKVGRIAARCGVYSLGVLLPFGATCLALWIAGVFDRFWFWTFSYAGQYVSAISAQQGMGILKSNFIPILSSSTCIWILAGVGTACSVLSKKIRFAGIFALGFMLFSFLATCPGFYFRPHYFILMLPAVGMMAGVGFGFLWTWFTCRGKRPILGIVPVLLGILTIGYTGFQNRDLLATRDPMQVSRLIYSGNPFSESLEIARYIREHSTPSDTIAIIGSEPQIYFYSRRRAATGYIYTYALMEGHAYAKTMQREMIDEIEANRPAYLVYVNVSTSWLTGPRSEKMILDWFPSYAEAHYRIVGVVDLISKYRTDYRWDWEAAGYRPRSKLWLKIYRRTDD